jgi:hypothetical protein
MNVGCPVLRALPASSFTATANETELATLPSSMAYLLQFPAFHVLMLNLDGVLLPDVDYSQIPLGPDERVDSKGGAR